MSSEVAILSIYLLQLDNGGRKDSMHWNERLNLDESKFLRLRIKSDGHEDDDDVCCKGSALLVPAASEVDISVAETMSTSSAGVRSSVASYCFVDSAYCVVKQAVAMSRVDFKSSASQLATREMNLLASINSAVQVLVSNSESKQFGDVEEKDFDQNSNLQTQVMFGGGDVGAVWWDCTR